MQKRRNAAIPAAIVLAIAAGVAGCGGGSRHDALPVAVSTGTPGARPPGAGTSSATATLSIAVPNNVATSGRNRLPRFVSSGTMTIAVSGVVHGSTAVPTSLTIADISSSAFTCTGTTFGRACTIQVPIPPSLTAASAGGNPIDLDVTTYNVALASIVNTNPTMTVAAQNPSYLLGDGTLASVSVVQNTANTALPPIVLSGKVSSYSVRTADAAGKIVIPATNASAKPNASPLPVAVVAKDAAGQTIIGPYLNPIYATITTPNSALSLQITNAGGQQAPQPLQTTIASSADALALISTGKGVLYDNLFIGFTQTSGTSYPIVPDNLTRYEDYDTFGNNGPISLGGTTTAGTTSVWPDTIANLDAKNNLVYAYEDGTGKAGGLGTITFGGASGPVNAQCALPGAVIAALTMPFTAMAVDQANKAIYLTDSTTTPNFIKVDALSINGGICSVTTQLSVPVAAGSPAPITSMTIAYDNNAQEVWMTTSQSLFAYLPFASAFRVFPDKVTPTNSNPFIDAQDCCGTALTPLQAFGTGTPYNLTFSSASSPPVAVTQGLFFGDTISKGLDVVDTGPSPAAAATPPIFIEASPNPNRFTNGSAAVIYTNAGTANFGYIDTTGNLYTLVSGNGITANSTSGNNWALSSPTYTVSGGGFGAQFGVNGAENGKVFWAVNAASRGFIRYDLTGTTGTAIPNIPSSLVFPTLTPKGTGAVVGGDGRIWAAENAGHRLFVYPGYGSGFNNRLGASFRRGKIDAQRAHT